jgi:UDP-glucose 4-epimerase
MSGASARIAIVVGGGFIGSAAAIALMREGWRVRQVTRAPTRAIEGVARIAVDYRSRAMADHLVGADALVFATGEMLPAFLPDDFAAAYVEQVAPVITLTERAHRAGVARIVFISSGGTVYGPAVTVPTREDSPTEPVNAYGCLKLQTEVALRFLATRLGISVVSLRVGNPYGPGQRTDRGLGFVSVVLDRALRGEEIAIWGDGEATRDFLYIDDLGRAIAVAAGARTTRDVINIGSGREISLNRVCALVEEMTGRTVGRSYHPPRSVDVPRSTLAIDRAWSELGWRPEVDLRQGMARMLERRG